MDPLVRASLAVRRLARRGHGLVTLAALAAWLSFGGPLRPFGVASTVVWVAWTALLVSRLRERMGHHGEAPPLLDFELGALLAVGLDTALLYLEGTLSGRFAPAVFVLAALVAAFARPLAGLSVVTLVVVLDALVTHVHPGTRGFDAFVVRAAFVLAFAVLNVAFLRAEVARVRMTARRRIDAELASLKEDARSYRLLGAGDAAGQDERSEDRLARSSVEEIHLSVHYALELLRRSQGLYTAVLLWLNDAATHLKISELSSASVDVNDAPFAAGDGLLGAVVVQRERVSLHGLKPSYKLPYYVGPCPVRALLAIPVLEEGALRGVLVMDREADDPFTPHEEEIGAQAARFCLRAIQNERIFVQLERAKVEQGKLYRAAQALASATGEKAVLEEAVRSAREIASFDHAAVTLWDEQTRTHEIRAAKSGDGEIDKLVGYRFPHNGGLVSMVVQNRFPLPYKGDFDAVAQLVIARRAPWPKVPSLLVLPLVTHDRVLGTLILGAKRRHAFGDAVRPTLEVLASHLAVSLANARMLHTLEAMATTDGLTGLLNKRAMLEAGTQKIAAAARFRRPLSVLITDIDFFKRVNDTYGHDVGDVVIRGLADVLKRQKRVTDLVGRFGGEEFVVLCEQTDPEGALLLAERIREELARTTFATPHGALKVTCSVGIATFPEGGADWESLFRAADEALYVSKRSGRNRSTVHRPRRAGEGARAKTA